MLCSSCYSCAGLVTSTNLRRARDRGHKVGHDDCSAKVLGCVRYYRLEPSAISQVQVPVIWPSDIQAVNGG